MADVYFKCIASRICRWIRCDCERMRGTKDNFMVFGLSDSANGGAVYEDGRRLQEKQVCGRKIKNSVLDIRCLLDI